MELIIHFISSLILGGVLYPFFGLSAFIVIIGGFIVDVDHYLLYICQFRKLEVKKALVYFREYFDKHYKGKAPFFIFHSIEFLLLLVLVSFYSEYVFLLTLGIILHYSLDFLYEMKLAGHLIKNWSLIMWLREQIIKNLK